MQSPRPTRGDAEHAYAFVRRAAQQLDRLAPDSTEGRIGCREALAALYEAEDRLHTLRAERIGA